MRYRRVRRDANHAAIARAYLRVGATVVDLAAQGSGVPDFLVGWRGADRLVEVKNPDRKGGKNNAADTLGKQAEFRASWRGAPVVVVETVEQALRAIGALA